MGGNSNLTENLLICIYLLSSSQFLWKMNHSNWAMTKATILKTIFLDDFCQNYEKNGKIFISKGKFIVQWPCGSISKMGLSNLSVSLATTSKMTFHTIIWLNLYETGREFKLNWKYCSLTFWLPSCPSLRKWALATAFWP